MGGNQIYAAVYGPREVHPRHMAKSDRGVLNTTYRMCTFSVHERKSPAPNRRDIEISKVVREAIEPVLFLEAYPDSAIDVFVEIVSADGGTRCASITCCSLALADAGIPMKSMVVGIACGKGQGKILLDLNDKEDKVGDADMPVAVLMKDKTISLLQFDGHMTPEELELAFSYILKGAEFIYSKQIEALKTKYDQISADVKQEDELAKQQLGESEESAPAAEETEEGAEEHTEDYDDAFHDEEVNQ
jgi:exosome complex component RRP41